MEENPSDDPFRFIGQNLNTSLSQEEEILECPLARQSQQFLDSESQSQFLTSSPPFEIIIESLPSTDPNTLQDDDNFLTPPEHHFSNASDFDNLKSPPHFGQPELTELEAGSTVDLGCEGCDCVIKDHQVEVVGRGFDENEGLEEMESGGGIDCGKSTQETEDVGGGGFGENGVLVEDVVSREVVKKAELGVGIDCGKSTQETENVGGGDFGENGVLGEDVVSKEVAKKAELGVGIDCGKSSQETEKVGGGDFGENGVLGEGIDSKEVAKKVELGDGVDCAESSQETEIVGKEIGDLNSEETVELCGDDVIKGVDEMKVQGRVDLHRVELFGTGGDLGFGMQGSLDEEQYDYIVRDIVTKVGCEFDEIGVLDRGFVPEKVTVCEEELKSGGLVGGNGCVGNMEHIENTDTDITLNPEAHAEEIKLGDENLVTHLDLAEKDTNEGDDVSKRKLSEENIGHDRGLKRLRRGGKKLVDGEGDGQVRERINLSENLVTHLDLAEKDTNEGDEVSKRKLLEENVGHDRGLKRLRRGGKKLVDGEGDGQVRERVNLSENCQDINGIDNGGHKEDVNLRTTGKRKRRGGKRKLRGSDKTNLGKSKEDIEKFKYVKPSDGVEQQARGENGRVNDETVSGKGNIPLAKTSECPPGEGEQGSVKNENIWFMNFLNKAAELFKREVDSDTEVDLIEILKKKGVKFPRPSWWPPEGFNR